MNLTQKKILMVVSLTPILFLFTNLISFSSSNRQNIQSRAFGPSPISADGRTIFNLDSNGNIQHLAFWRDMRRKVDTIFIHSLYLDHVGHFQKIRPDLVSLNENQVQGLIKIQKDLDFNVKIDLGLGLGQHCSSTLSAFEVADRASNQEMSLLRRFYFQTQIVNGQSVQVERTDKLRIDGVMVDGPFLRVIEGSKKAISCHVTNSNNQIVRRGFEEDKAIEIVGRYLSHIQRKIAAVQNNVIPEIGIVLNLPNWSIPGYLGEFGVTELNIQRVLEKFGRTPFYPSISEIALDYPYGYVVKNPAAFSARLQVVHNSLRHIRGNPRIGIIANEQLDMTAAEKLFSTNRTDKNFGKRGIACIDKKTQVNPLPLLLVYENNACLNGTKTVRVDSIDQNGNNTSMIGMFKEEALSIIDFGDRKYVDSTINYHHLIQNNLPQGVQVNSVYYESWYDFPSNNKVFGAKLLNIIQN